MIHDQSAFKAATAYADATLVEDRVRRFLPMVRKSAWFVFGAGRDGLEVEDLIQAGLIALTECAQKHAGPNEDGFAAYAKIRVRGAMFDVIRKLMPEGRTVAGKRARLTEARDLFEGEHGRPPTDIELAEQLGISVHDVHAMDTAPIQIAQIDDAYDESNSAFADDTPDAFEILSRIDDRERLLSALEELPERSKLILQLHFVEELNLTEIAEVLEVSVPRVHQLKAKALAQMRELLE